VSTTIAPVNSCEEGDTSVISLFAPRLRETPKNAPLDDAGQRVLDAWPTLPAALPAGILAMIEAARK
jgi:hypothetical protein